MTKSFTMKRIVRNISATIFTVALTLTVAPRPANAFGDAVILLQILSNAVTQLQNLMTIVQQGKDTLSLTREINSGLNDTLSLIEVIKSRPDLKLYQGWQDVEDSIRKIETIYGKTPKSNLSDVQSQRDRAAAEGLTSSDSASRAVTSYDLSARNIQMRAAASSPKGAARLTAQGVGVMVQVMNESLRAQSSALKLQAQSIAVDNQKEKEETRQLKDASDGLSKVMKTHKSNFQAPEF